jgi:hypothetical protein
MDKHGEKTLCVGARTLKDRDEVGNVRKARHLSTKFKCQLII